MDSLRSPEFHRRPGLALSAPGRVSRRPIHGGLARAFRDAAAASQPARAPSGDRRRERRTSSSPTARTVRPTHIVVATNTPFNDRVTMHTKQAAYRTYVVGLRGRARTAFPRC